MNLIPLTNESQAKVNGLLIVATHEALQGLVAHMLRDGRSRPGVFQEALELWQHPDSKPCRYAIVCDTVRGTGMQFADCADCAQAAIEVSLKRLQAAQLDLVGYAVAVPAGNDSDALNGLLARSSALYSEHVGGHA